MAKLTNETSNKLPQEICADSRNATSSQESADGRWHCDLPGGRTKNRSGQEAVHANRFHLPGDKKVKQMIATYGRSGNASSASAALQQFLESKLQVRLPTGGLTMFIKGWKRSATPLGRLYCQLAASVRPINATDYGLWVSPTAQDYSRGNKPPRPTDTGVPLSQQVAFWATPNTMDHLPLRSKEAMARQFSTTRKGRTTPANLREQVLPAMWPTASATKNTKNSKDPQRMKEGGVQTSLADAAWIAAKGLWPAPRSADGDKGVRTLEGHLKNRERYKNGVDLPTATRLSAPTENKGSLNPAFVCWLMGYPIAWENCADMVTPLSRKPRPSS